MPTLDHMLPTRPREGEPVRDHQARLAIGLVRPLMLAIGTLAAGVNELLDPGAVPTDGWIRLAIFGGLQVAFWLLLATSWPMERIALLAFSLDGLVLGGTLLLSEIPAATATTFIVLIVIVGYFARPVAALVFSLVVGAGLAIYGPRLEGWDDPGAVPVISVAAVITGVAMSYLSSRTRAAEDSLKRVVAEQQASLERLRQVDLVRDRLLANVSHELRTPLTLTVGSIETLLREDVELEPAERERMLHLARDGGLRLLALVEDLLAVGATRPDSLELSLRREQLGALARDAIEGIAAEPGRSIRVEVLDDGVVRVERLRMLQVIANLVVNAMRHGAGDVVVETSTGNHTATIRVLDEGAGVDPSHVDELFMPFARFSDRPDSTGLGLAICRTIVEAHGGSIAYERTDDDRTSFTVRLPMQPPDERR